MARGKSSFGSVRKLPSGKYQARYTGPDLVRHTAPVTFQTIADAEGWLATQRADILRDSWQPIQPKVRSTFGEYAEQWLTGRDLKPRTRDMYRRILDRHLLPEFEAKPLRAITVTDVKAWQRTFDKNLTDKMRETREKRGATGATVKAHAYGLLRTILNTAIEDELLTVNPCRVRGAGSVKRASVTKPATLGELETIAATMPAKYRALVLISAWCGLRFGEATELRRDDLDLTKGVIHVRRAAVRIDGKPVVGPPKSLAGVRDVAIPPHLLPMLREHVTQHAVKGKAGLLFPARDGGHLHPTTLHRVFKPAREKAGRDDLRWHDLRHTGAVLAAQTGATLAELMSRLGHSTPAAALRYQHAAQGRDELIAQKLSELAGGIS